MEMGGGRGRVLGSRLWPEIPAGGDGEGVRVHRLDTTLHSVTSIILMLYFIFTISYYYNYNI